MTAYTLLDANAPNGAQTPAAFSTSALANVRALRDAVVCGHVPGFSFSQSGGTNLAPTYRMWANAATGIRFRVECTYHGTFIYMPLTAKWWWSDDAGSTWAAMDATAANITWDATNGWLHIVGVDRDAGMWIWGLSGMVCAINAHVRITLHFADNAFVAHGGLGTMAAQNANTVAVTGGALDAVTIGATTPGPVNATRVVEQFANYNPTPGASVVVSWGVGGSVVANNGVNNITFASIPAGAAGHMLYVSNLNNTTFTGVTMAWGLGSKPSIAGACFLTLITFDSGGTVFASVAWRAV